MAKFTFTLSIGFANAEQIEEVEIEDADLEGLEGDALTDFMYERWKEWAWEYIDGGWYAEGEKLPRW